MAIDTIQPRSRRALLSTAVGGVAAAAVASVARVGPAEAANGDPVKVGQAHTGSAVTSITNETNNADVLRARSAGQGTAIQANSQTGVGVRGAATSGIGVVAQSSAGYALITAGRIQFAFASGLGTIAAGQKSHTISLPFDVNVRTFVLLTPMANIGSRALWFTKKAAANQIVIRMSSARSASTRVAWLALEHAP
jgi:hypothetical protein